jgi:hypothetical protein
MPRDPDNMFGGEPPRGDYPGRQRNEVTVVHSRRHRLATIVSMVGVLLFATAMAVCFGWAV